MKSLMISDVHANLQALEAVLEETEGLYDRVICLGDTVGYGANPKECFDRVKTLAQVWVRGNHDDMAGVGDLSEWSNGQAQTAIKYTRHQLSREDLDYLGALPLSLEKDLVVFVHGSLQDELYEYLLDPIAVEHNLEILSDRLAFHGHSHVPGIIRRLDGELVLSYQEGKMELLPGMFVNPGSVGQPRDNDWRSSFAIWDSEDRTVNFRRTSYDIRGAQKAILAANLDPISAKRLEFGQ